MNVNRAKGDDRISTIQCNLHVTQCIDDNI